MVDYAIALDGDKIKPRIDQRKGGNGFGVNEDNVGYTLTVPDRHGVAYGVNTQGGMNPCFTEHSETLAVSRISGVAQAVRLDLHMGGDVLTDKAQTIRANASATISGGVVLCEQEPAPMAFYSRLTAVSGEGACGDNVDITQTASQYKEPHGVIIPMDEDCEC